MTHMLEACKYYLRRHFQGHTSAKLSSSALRQSGSNTQHMVSAKQINTVLMVLHIAQQMNARSVLHKPGFNQAVAVFAANTTLFHQDEGFELLNQLYERLPSFFCQSA